LEHIKEFTLFKMAMAKSTLWERLIITGIKAYVDAKRLKLECDEGGEDSARSDRLKG